MKRFVTVGSVIAVVAVGISIALHLLIVPPRALPGYQLWTRLNGSIIERLMDDPWPRSLSLSPFPGGDALACSAAERVDLVEVPSGARLRTLSPHSSFFFGLARAIPVTRERVITSVGRMLQQWDSRTGTEGPVLHGHWPAGDAAYDARVSVDDVAATARLVIELGQNCAWVPSSLVVSPDGRYLVVGCDGMSQNYTLDGNAQFPHYVAAWDLTTGLVSSIRFEWPGPTYDVAFSPDGKFVAFGNYGEVGICSFPEGRRAWTVNRPQVQFCSVAFSPDGAVLAWGQLAAYATKVGEIVLAAAADGSELRRLDAHCDGVLHIAFSPDGKRIVSGGVGGVVSVWDAATGKELSTNRLYESDVYDVIFSPNGKWFATAGESHSRTVVDIWLNEADTQR